MRIDFLVLCFLTARNNLDSKSKELCNCCAACADMIQLGHYAVEVDLPPVTETPKRSGLSQG